MGTGTMEEMQLVMEHEDREREECPVFSPSSLLQPSASVSIDQTYSEAN